MHVGAVLQTSFLLPILDDFINVRVDAINDFVKNLVNRFSTLQVFVGDFVCLFQFQQFELGKNFIKLFDFLVVWQRVLTFFVDQFGEEEIVLLYAVVHRLQKVAKTSISHKFVIFMNPINSISYNKFK